MTIDIDIDDVLDEMSDGEKTDLLASLADELDYDLKKKSPVPAGADHPLRVYDQPQRSHFAPHILDAVAEVLATLPPTMSRDEAVRRAIGCLNAML